MGYITTHLKLDTDIRQDKIFTTFQRGEHLGRQLCISIYANGSPFLSENVSRFRLQFDNEEQTSVVAYASSTNASVNPHYTYDNKEGYQIFYDVPGSVVAKCGVLHCKISIISAQDVTLKTCLFKIRVDDGMIPDNEIVYVDTQKTLEQLFKEFDKGATSIETVGSGNAVTKASYNENNRKITLTKEKSFALASDISDAFVNVNFSDGVLTFGNKKDAPDRVDLSSLLDGIAPYQEITQAEYDALSPNEKTNGTVYFIKDAVSNLNSALINSDIYGEKQLSLNNGVKENTIKIIDGTYSAAIGTSNIVEPDYSIAVGYGNKLFKSFLDGEGMFVRGSQSAAFGSFNAINSTNSATIGRENHIVDGNTSFLSGEGNYSTQEHDFCLGYNLRAYSPNQFVCGVNNEADDESKYMFIVGNGVDDEGFFDAVYDSNGNEMTDEHGNALTTNQKNIFTIDRKGNVDITGDYYDSYGRKPFHYYSFDGINQTECYIVIPDEKWNKTLPTANCPFYFNFSNSVSTSNSNGLSISFYRNSYRDPDGYSGNHCIVDRNYNPITSISTGAHLFLWEPNKKINNITGCFVLLEDIEADGYEHPKYTARSKGLYKIASDDTGHVLEAEPVTKNDIAALGFASSEGVENAQNVNLLVGSHPNITTASYNMASFGFAEEPKDGETVTMILKGALGSDRTALKPHMGGGVHETDLQDIGNGYYASTFTWKQGNSSNRTLNIYQFPSSGTSASTIEWVKLVRGETASKEWSDGIPNKYSYSDISGAGWRRIAEYNALGQLGVVSGLFEVTIGRSYTNNNNEIHKAQIAYTHNSFKIVNLLDKCNTQVMTKLRVVYDSNKQKNYLEMYYNASGTNKVYVKIDEGEVPTDGCWVAISPELVTDESALSIKAEAELPTSFDASVLAKTDGSNASGTWGINVSGNAATATKATQDGNGNNIANTYAKKSIYGDNVISMGRKLGTYVGANSFAFGTDIEASGDNSHSEGDGAAATDECAHAEGLSTTASQPYAHAEGYKTVASGQCAHSEGELSKASGHAAHAEGEQTEAKGSYAHSEGAFTTASGKNSHAEGNCTTASGPNSHAEGEYSSAQNQEAHAEGSRTVANGAFSHAEGSNTVAANKCSHAGGHFNVYMNTGGEINNTVGHALAIGNGTSSSARSNAFSVMFDGTVKAAKTITASTSADYAEFFEWKDGNPDREDRVGLFVALDVGKIRLADEGDDYILGIVSGQPFVLGNGDCDVWNGMHLRDKFGRVIYEPAPKTEIVYIDREGNKFREGEEFDRAEIVNMEEETVMDEEGNVIYEGERPVINPDYDPNQTYISRFERPEWSPVGMLGVLAVYDDGTCQENGYCRCGQNGVATSAKNGYRVIERITDNIVKIIFR